MIENVTAIGARWQTIPTFSLDYEAEPETNWTSTLLDEGTDVDVVLNAFYRMPERHARRSDTYLMAEGSNRVDTIAYKRVAESSRRNLGQSVTEHQTVLQYPDPHPISGVCVYAPKPSHTFTPDIFVSHFYRDTDNLIHLLRAIRRSSAGVHLAGISASPEEEAGLDDRARRLLEMDALLRGFSELPEDWDSYGGYPISPDIIDEARKILAAGIYLNLPSAWAAPGGDGGIGIQWDSDQTELYIDIVPGEETTYALALKAENKAESEGVLTMANLSEVLRKLAESAA